MTVFPTTNEVIVVLSRSHSPNNQWPAYGWRDLRHSECHAEWRHGTLPGWTGVWGKAGQGCRTPAGTHPLGRGSVNGEEHTQVTRSTEHIQWLYTFHALEGCF